MADYRNLRVWQKCSALSPKIFDVADTALKARHADLSDQMKRAVGSMGANIAEGSGHKSRKEFARFLTYSLASTNELENHLQLAYDIKLIDWKAHAKLGIEVETIRKMLEGLRGKLNGS